MSNRLSQGSGKIKLMKLNFVQLKKEKYNLKITKKKYIGNLFIFRLYIKRQVEKEKKPKEKPQKICNNVGGT